MVPALQLGTVPFALLQPYGEGGGYLVDSVSIVVAPSLFDAFQAVGSWGRPTSAVVVGNPTAVGKSGSLPSLPGAEREAQAAALLFGTQAIIGEHASKPALRRALAEKVPSVLYLATHGVADDLDPLENSFIALAGENSNSGNWTAREIQETNLRGVALAVLSACQTGLGKTHDAGVIGLARAFQLAGVPRVVMSLWNVDDEATAQLMLDFTREIKSRSPSDALQLAVTRMRARDPNPAHWAAFVLFGSIW